MRRTTQPESEIKANLRKMILGRTMHALTSTLVSRAKLGQDIGKTFAGDRDLYVACGYPKTISFRDFEARYQRQDIAKRIINAFPAATWRAKPDIYETEDANETPFEKLWNELLLKIKVWHYLLRVDKMAGVGQYATLLLGFDDVQNVNDLASEVKPGKGRRLLYLRPFYQNGSAIGSWVKEASDVRFGLPETYQYNLTIGDSSIGDTGTAITAVFPETVKVHWSRVLHVADGCLDNDVYGTPRLEAVFNRLLDLDKTLGGCAEGYWRDGFPGMAFELDPEADYSQTLDTMEDEIENYIHNLTRTIKLQGVKVTPIATETTDPKPMTEVELQMISAASGIPVRILTGSERGELSSAQDESNWNSRVDERRKDFAEPIMIREFIQRLIKYGVLPEPKELIVNWPDAHALNEKDKAEVAKNKAQTISFYLTHPGAEMILPPYYFLTMILGLTEEQAQSIEDDVDKALLEEKDDADAAAESLREEEEAAAAEAEEAERKPKKVVPKKAK